MHFFVVFCVCLCIIWRANTQDCEVFLYCQNMLNFGQRCLWMILSIKNCSRKLYVFILKYWYSITPKDVTNKKFIQEQLTVYLENPDKKSIRSDQDWPTWHNMCRNFSDDTNSHCTLQAKFIGTSSHIQWYHPDSHSLLLAW